MESALVLVSASVSALASALELATMSVWVLESAILQATADYYPPRKYRYR